MIISDKLTICILSKNKNLELYKLLDYWGTANFNVIVLHETNNPLIFKEKNYKLKYLPSQNSFFDRLLMLSKLIKTEYVLVSPDDEIFSISSIYECLEFLDKNPEFSAAAGQTVATWKYGNQECYNFAYSDNLKYETTKNSALGRVYESISSNRGVMRIGAPYRIMRQQVFTNFTEALNGLQPISCGYLYEVLAEIYQNIHGKVIILDNVYWYRNWITPSGDISRDFYYFNWWESLEHSDERENLRNVILKQYNLKLDMINAILEASYGARKKREASEIIRLNSRKVSSRFKAKTSIYKKFQRFNFFFHSPSLSNLQINLDNNGVRYKKEELKELTKFIFNISNSHDNS
jgi:glycosyltransferase domain-containing protein